MRSKWRDEGNLTVKGNSHMLKKTQRSYSQFLYAYFNEGAIFLLQLL